MAIELKMPALSPTMEKGTLAKWLVAEGDMVKAGDLIAEIETDKATMEYEAVDDGRIAKLVIAEGTDGVAVGAVIALLAGEGEAAPAPAAPAAVAAPVAAPAATDTSPTGEMAGDVEAARQAPQRDAQALPRTGELTFASAAAPVAAAETAPTARRIAPADRIKISPLAARIAKAKGIDLAAIEGSGPSGRIVRADLGIGSLLAAPTVVAAASAVPVIAPPPAGVPAETAKLSSMRKTIARRLGESKQTVPHFYLTARCNIDPLLKLRGELNASLAARGEKLSVNDLVMKAMATALTEVPHANVQFGGDELHRFGRVDISMAVAIEGGLITPVIRGVDTLSLSAIAKASQNLAAKAREGKLAPDDYQGGTASISNLGMYGIDEMVPVINPPQALILGVGAGIEQPWKVDGEIALATIMAATASFDHRAIDGAVAAQFMASFKAIVENPLAILG
jgi:pyruvate dehydrogenase E2 component (dihydrolipoamide acetyltransferase)